MSGKDIEGILKALFFLFGLCLMVISLIFLPFAIQAHKTREQRQRDAMAAKAKEFGLDFSGEDNQNIAKELLHIDKLDDLSGSDKHALNVLSGDYDGHSVTLFDFHYATSGVWWWAPSWTIHNYASFVTLNLGKAFPELTIGAEGGGLFGAISDAFGGGDIDFESHEFSERYEVRSNSKKFAYDICNAQMIDYLLDRPANLIEVDKDTLAIGFDAEHNAARMDSVLSHLLKIRSLMPAYLFEKGHGHPDRVIRQSTGPGAPVVPGGLELNGEIGAGERNSFAGSKSGDKNSRWYLWFALPIALIGLVVVWPNHEPRPEMQQVQHATEPRNGDVTHYWSNGKKHIDESYVNGKLHGVQVSYNPTNGQKYSERHWVDGVEDGITTVWYPNGVKNSEVHIVSGKQEGLTTTWYWDGQKQSEAHYRKGIRNGLSTGWHPNGQKSEESLWADSGGAAVRVGVFTEWYMSGQKSHEYNYDDRTRIRWDEQGNKTEGQ